MLKLTRNFLAVSLALIPATVSAVPQIAVANDRVYRATGVQSFEYKGGELLFIIYDGNAFSSVECPFLPAGPPVDGFPLLPYPPGSIPCPAGHNAFITTRFGDRDRDVLNRWGRLGSVDEATRVPARLPGLIELIAAPITSLPRPSRDFVDRSTLVLHDLQSATFREKDASRYHMLREYFVGDGDSNGDGELSAAERAAIAASASSEEIRHLRETIIFTGNSNGYLFDYPIRPWIELNKDLDPVFAPRDEIAVNQLKFLEAYPGISNRAGITNTSEGFFFKDLTNFGTDYDGDPALLVDFRSPGSIAWDGNNFSNLISGLDDSFLKVFERRFTDDGTPLVYAGAGEVPVTAVRLGDNPGDPVILTASRPPEIDPDTLELVEVGHGFESGEELFIYETGFTFLDGKRFFASNQSEQTGFNGLDQMELYLDEGLNSPVTLTSLPDGTLGVLNPTTAGVADVPDIVLTPGVAPSVSTLEAHGLADGDSFTLDGTGLTPFEGLVLFAGNTTANTIDLFTDAALTTPLVYAALPDAALLTAVILGTEQNDFEFPIWPFPFVDQNFGGQLLLPSVFDRGYEFPDVAFRLFFGTPFGAQNLGLTADPARNDLILRLRFSRSVATANISGSQALVPGDLSRRDYELELCLIDTLEGATKAFAEVLAGESAKSKSKGAKSDTNDGFSADEDFDGDGQSNLFEFAFDVSGTFTEEIPALGDAETQISAQVSVEINPETSLCELTVGKRPGVREYLEYYFEEVGPDGVGVEIDPEAEGATWEVVADDNLTYKLVSTQPVSGSSFFRACARKNTFGVEIITE